MYICTYDICIHIASLSQNSDHYREMTANEEHGDQTYMAK